MRHRTNATASHFSTDPATWLNSPGIWELLTVRRRPNTGNIGPRQPVASVNITEHKYLRHVRGDFLSNPDP